MKESWVIICSRRSTLGCIESPEVDDAKVDLPYFVGIVVQESDDLVSVFGIDIYLFGDLALDGGFVGVEGIAEKRHIVNGIDVASDADGAFGDKAGFARAFAADIGEVFAIASYNYIGNYLLVGWVLFGDGTGQE